MATIRRPSFLPTTYDRHRHADMQTRITIRTLFRSGMISGAFHLHNQTTATISFPNSVHLFHFHHRRRRRRRFRLLNRAGSFWRPTSSDRYFRDRPLRPHPVHPHFEPPSEPPVHAASAVSSLRASVGPRPAWSCLCSVRRSAQSLHRSNHPPRPNCSNSSWNC